MLSNVNKTMTRFQNGEKVAVEETNTTKTLDKKTIKKSSNFGASLDLNLDFCQFCKTKIN